MERTIFRRAIGNFITQKGGAVESAYMYKLAEKDGTEIAMMAPGSITAPLVNPIDYDARRLAWLGSIVARSSASTCRTMMAGSESSSTAACARVSNATTNATITSIWLRIVGRSTATATMSRFFHPAHPPRVWR